MKAIAISLTRDGLGLKPSLECDERKKVLVGSKEKIDIDYIKKNPVPDPCEAPDQTGEEVLAEVDEIAGQLQTCLGCLEVQSKSSNSILICNSGCTFCCESCFDQKEACRECQENNKKKVTSKGTKLDLEPSVKTPVAMTSLADEILFLADTGTKRLFEARVEKANFKLDCYMRTVMKFKDNVNSTRLCHRRPAEIAAC